MRKAERTSVVSWRLPPISADWLCTTAPPRIPASHKISRTASERAVPTSPATICAEALKGSAQARARGSRAGRAARV
jgi:hypothetical protein